MNSKQIYITIVLLIAHLSAAFAEGLPTTSLKGVVRDAETKELLSFATIQLFPINQQGFYSAITNIKGEFTVKRLPLNKYKLAVSFVGYDKQEKVIELLQPHLNTLTIYLQSSVTALNEVTVTASESKGMTSASKIDQTAMEHLQPTSFSDLLELLPGGHSVDPNMSVTNLMGIREAGSVRQTVPSLGVKFMIDGSMLNTDANFQSVPGISLGGDKESVGVGVDMRMLSTDDIKSVEVVRGIPSVEFGDLTSGVVKIKRKRRATPYRARIKADLLSKLVSLGKGYNLTANDVLNVDLGWLDSKVDPRNNRENYKRINSSVRWNANRSTSFGALSWNLDFDYNRSYDEVKRNKDISQKEDKYQSSYDKFFLRSGTKIYLNKEYWFSTLYSHLSLSYELNKIKEDKTISLDRPKGVPELYTTGEADGYYLPYHYLAHMQIDGKPFYFNWHLKAESKFKALSFHHNFKMGALINSSKNYGDGQLFNAARPLNIHSVVRPRRFKDIPAVTRASFYIEDALERSLSNHHFTLLLGLRSNALLGLNQRYKMHNKHYFDPRFNLQWNFPAFGTNRDWHLTLNLGIGWLSQMPTATYLYPKDRYNDIPQLNYYHVNPKFRRLNFMSYKWNDTNYDIEPACNRKSEVRVDLSHKEHHFSVTYFREYMNNAFRTLTYYKQFQYKQYSTDNISADELVGPPNVDELSFQRDTLINVYSKPGNGTRVRKQGVEFQYSSPRFQSLKTRFTVMGAWYKTTYSNRSGEYKESSILLNGKQLQYIGYYDWEDGTIKERFNTNIITDTYLPKIGMNVSLTAQCVWFTSSQPLWNSGAPLTYIDKAGAVHPYTEESAKQLELKHLLNSYTEDYFERTTVPLAIDFNLKATKHLTKYMRVALFVNRVLTYYPEYHRNGALIRRTSSPYFGMEANFTF